jgi:uronate dehydrogenase
VRTIRTVLLTGAAGRLGSVLRERLGGRFELLRLSDIRPMAPAQAGEETIVCDLADAEAVERLCAGIDAVLHFGGIAFDCPWNELLPANIAGTANIFEAARKTDVERVIFASSNHVIGLYPVSQRLDEKAQPRPDSFYGVSKAFGEDLAAHYAWKHGIRTFAMRIGSCRAEPDGLRALSTWLSFGDLERLVMTGLTADYAHEIVYGVSRNARAWWDNSNAYRLGYDPQDDAEAYANRFGERPPDGGYEATLQGGSAAARGFSRQQAGAAAEVPSSLPQQKTG